MQWGGTNGSLDGTCLATSNHGVYYFRKVVPEALRPAIGLVEFRRSLRTKDIVLAKLERWCRCGRLPFDRHQLYDLADKVQFVSPRA